MEYGATCIKCGTHYNGENKKGLTYPRMCPICQEEALKEWQDAANNEQAKREEACVEVLKLQKRLAQDQEKNAYVVKYAQDLCDWVEIWATGCPNDSDENLESMISSAQQLKHVLSQSGHGADLLWELEQLRDDNRLLNVAASRAMEHAKDPKVISAEDMQDYVEMSLELAIQKKAYEMACAKAQNNGCPHIAESYNPTTKDNPYKVDRCNKCMETYGDSPPIATCYEEYFLYLASKMA